MSFTYLQESGGGFSVACSPDIPRSERSNLLNTLGKCLSNGKWTAYCPSSPFGTTFAHSGRTIQTADGSSNTCEAFTTTCKSAADFPVPTFPRSEKKQESKEKNLLFGVKWRASLGKFDREACSWRTRQTLLFEDSTECLQTLPSWGMTANGELWEGTIWERPEEKDCGYWGSPKAMDWFRYKFTPEQNLRTTFGGARNSCTVEYLRIFGEYPSPDFPEWIMDFPKKWSALSEAVEWHKFHQWRESWKPFCVERKGE